MEVAALCRKSRMVRQKKEVEDKEICRIEFDPPHEVGGS